MSVYILIAVFILLLLFGMIYIFTGKKTFGLILLVISFVILSYICKIFV